MTLDTAEVWAPGAGSGIAARPTRRLRKAWTVASPWRSARPRNSSKRRPTLDADGILRLRLATADAGTIRLVARFAVVDPVALWRPGSGEGRGTLPPSWVEPRTTRALADIPIGCLVGRHDTALVGFGVEAGGRPVQVRAGMIEESGEFLLELHIEQSAAAEVVLDLRGADFADSVRSVARAIGLRREAASVHDEQPVLCTWYSFHQDLVVDELLADARIAGELGIGTVIIDDGWQTTDAARGYGSCGDWAGRAGQDPRPARPRARARGTGAADAVVDRNPVHRVSVAGVPGGADPAGLRGGGPRCRRARPALADRPARARRAAAGAARRHRSARVQARLPRAVRAGRRAPAGRRRRGLDRGRRPAAARRDRRSRRRASRS